MYPKIIIFRHSQSTDNVRNIFSGWRDPSLTELGRKQARKIAKQVADDHVDVAFTSSRKRARDTLKIALGKQKPIIIVDDRLIERSYGDWQGTSKLKKQKELGEKKWKRYHRGYDTPPPGGESIKNVEKRVNSFIRDLEHFLAHCPVTVAISCHGNSMRPLRKHFQKLTLKQMLALENPQDTDIELNIQHPHKKCAHQEVHKIYHNKRKKTTCPMTAKQIIKEYFPGRRVVKVRLPKNLKPRF